MERPKRINVPLAMGAELNAQIEAARVETKLSKQDVMRKGLEFGVPILIERLTGRRPGPVAG